MKLFLVFSFLFFTSHIATAQAQQDLHTTAKQLLKELSSDEFKLNYYNSTDNGIKCEFCKV